MYLKSIFSCKFFNKKKNYELKNASKSQYFFKDVYDEDAQAFGIV